MGMIERCWWTGLSVPFIHTEIYLNEKRLCPGILWITAMDLDTFPGNLQSIGGKRCGKYTGESAPDWIFHLPKSVSKCSGKVFQFWWIPYQIVIEFTCHPIPFLDTISSRACLVILVWHGGDASKGLVAERERCRQCAVGTERWVRTGQCWAIRKGSMEKAFFEMNLEEVAGP